MAAQAVLIQDGVFIYRRNTPRLAGMIECLYENFSSWQVGSWQQIPVEILSRPDRSRIIISLYCKQSIELTLQAGSCQMSSRDHV